MKKFVLLLMTALALPMFAQTATKAEMMARNDRSQMEEIIPFKVVNATPSFKMDRGKILWDFETDESFAGWLIYDADGDGYNWEVDDYYSYNGGTYSLTSRSFYGSALNPDNWLVSPEVPLEGTLTIHAMNYSGTWPDMFAVYVYEGGQPEYEEDFADFVKISDDIAAPAAWTEYTFDLSEYAGRTGCFAIRHYNSYDQFRLIVDYISIGIEVPVPATPTELSVEPADTTAEVIWTDEENNTWNLRYRAYSFFEDFEAMGNTGDPIIGDWTTIDGNGDGYTWYIWDPVYSGYDSGDGVTLFGSKCATSPSWAGSALRPDNWLISPKVNLEGELSFWAGGQDPSYCDEHFAVFVTTGDPYDLDSYVQISDEFIATSPIQEYTCDLSVLRGQEGYIAIRHFNTYDMFRLNVDNFMIGDPWIYVNDLTDNFYTITDLDPETTYEVQVQGTDGDMTGDWTSCRFTTTEKTSIEEISADVKGDNRYYNMMGQQVDGNNLPAGIYIHNGKKILVK